MSSKLLIIVPSRGRPANAKRLLDKVLETTSTSQQVDIIFALDHSDETKYEYPSQHIVLVNGGSMVKALNEVALHRHMKYSYIAFMGDDVLPRGDWLREILNVLETGPNMVVYGNDLAQQEKLPTSVFMDSNIVNTLGFMAPPNQRQLYVDNFWKHLGEHLGTLVYVETAVLEHLHPHVQKAPHDILYEKAYSIENETADRDTFEKYMLEDFNKDMRKFL